MMRLPNGEVIMHGGVPYDPVKAHDYYMRNRQLKGRKKGQVKDAHVSAPHAVAKPQANRARQKQQLGARITGLEKKLQELNQLIKIKEAALKRSHATMKARGQKPGKPTASDKSKAARESKQYRQKHKTELAAKAKAADKKAGGSPSSGGQAGKSEKAGAGKPDSQKSIKNLKMLATRVRGQLQAAKAKLSTL